MTFRRLWDRGSRRAAGEPVPSGVRQRFAFTHPALTADHLRAVEDAAAQWFRLVERHPRARPAMPSVAVEELCRLWNGHAVASPAGDQGKRLRLTLRLAQRDEGCPPDALPLLFRVDREVGIPGGRRYLIDCGGRGQCFPVPDATCLIHLTGPGRPVRGDWKGPNGPGYGWDNGGLGDAGSAGGG